MINREEIMHLMGIERPNFLKEYYNVSNNGGLLKLNEETLSRIINKHGTNGFVILSANRSDKSNEENNKATKSLINDLKNSNYGYYPVYGGYHGTDGVVDEYEPSFIVFNYNRNGEATDFSDLKLFALQMCGKYMQNSVLIKEPSNPPYYANAEGDIVGKANDNSVDTNNADAEYYTSLIKSKSLDYQNPDRLKRFTYPIQFECYCNPNPVTINELRQRKDGYGEIITSFRGKEL